MDIQKHSRKRQRERSSKTEKNREKRSRNPIDKLNIYLLDDHHLGLHGEKPYYFIRSLKFEQLDQLCDDIKQHLGLLYKGTGGATLTPLYVVEFWEAILVVSESELAYRFRCGDGDGDGYQELGFRSKVEIDVRNLLKKMSYESLLAVQGSIEGMIQSGEAQVVEFWKVISERLHVYLARAYLSQFHAKKIKMRKY